jgi:ferric-chelate reductase
LIISVDLFYMVRYALAGKWYMLSFGFLSSVQFALALLPVSRTSIFLYTLGIPFERALKWHRIFVGVAALALLAHGVTMWYANRENPKALWRQVQTIEGAGNLYGTLSGIALLPIVALSWEPIRRRFFEVFYYVHQLFIVGIVLAWVHSKSALYLGLFPVAAHLIDRGLRWWRARQPVTLLGARVLPAGGGRRLTEIRLHAPHLAHFEAGDYVFLNMPALSHLAWHPFTIRYDSFMSI